jgi:hypothetical protein
LKKQYFNREERSLDEIIKGKPPTVNEHQWRALVGFWCQEPHKVTSFYKTFVSNLKVIDICNAASLSSIFAENMCNKLSVCKRTEEYTHNREKKPC